MRKLSRSHYIPHGKRCRSSFKYQSGEQVRTESKRSDTTVSLVERASAGRPHPGRAVRRRQRGSSHCQGREMGEQQVGNRGIQAGSQHLLTQGMAARSNGFLRTESIGPALLARDTYIGVSQELLGPCSVVGSANPSCGGATHAVHVRNPACNGSG